MGKVYTTGTGPAEDKQEAARDCTLRNEAERLDYLDLRWLGCNSRVGLMDVQEKRKGWS